VEKFFSTVKGSPMKKSIFSQFSGPSSTFGDMSQDKAIRERISQRMVELNVSMRFVSERVGRHYTWLNKFMKTRTSLDYDVAEKMAKVLKCDVDWLLRGAGQVENSPTIEANPLSNRYGGVNSLPSATAPMVGFTEEGVFKRVMSKEDVADLPRITINKSPGLEHVDHFCYSVRGDTLKHRGISDGDVVICIGANDLGVPLTTGRLVVAENVENGFVETVLREVEVTQSTVRLHAPGAAAIEFPRGAPPETVRLAGVVVAAQKSFLNI
jgi:SOS-response transcriptional repressor LexA